MPIVAVCQRRACGPGADAGDLDEMSMTNRRYPGANPTSGSRKQPDTAGPDQCSVAGEWLSGSRQRGPHLRPAGQRLPDLLTSSRLASASNRPRHPLLAEAATGINADWTSAREAEYERSRRLALVHIYKPSARRGQKYDISIYLMRHLSGQQGNQTTVFTEIEKAEFFFGHSWGNRIFPSINNGGVIGVSTSACGTFWRRAV
jgi:hypothetical protein